MVRSIVSLVKTNAGKAKKSTERNSLRCQPFVFRWQVDGYTAERQKREKKGQGRQWFRSFARQTTCRWFKEKQRRGNADGTLVRSSNRLAETKKRSTEAEGTPGHSGCQSFVWHANLSQKTKQKRTGKTSKHQLFIWLA